MKKASKIYVAGHTGLVGSALLRVLSQEGYRNIVVRTHKELDLTEQSEVAALFERERPEYVFLAAAKVGGILANSTYPADFIYQNLAIQTNVIHQSFLHGVKRLLFLGSSCIYPREAPNPMKEEYLLTGLLEPTNEAYAIAKIAGIKMCHAYNRQHGAQYLTAVPANLYGPRDHFDLEEAHVIPALIRKFHEAKINNESSVAVWGSGRPRREFLYVDDLARACIFLMKFGDDDFKKLLNPCNDVEAFPPINIGVGKDISISELAEIIKEIVGFKGEIRYDHTKPDGIQQKLLDVQRIYSLGWRPKVSLKKGIKLVYEQYCSELQNEATVLSASKGGK